MIRACIFDLGGTIVDKYSLTPFNALRKAFLTYNLSIVIAFTGLSAKSDMDILLK